MLWMKLGIEVEGTCVVVCCMQMILCYRRMGGVTNDVDIVEKYVMKWFVFNSGKRMVMMVSGNVVEESG